MTKENVIEKVRKLIALADADGGGTEAERALAMEKAQKLLWEHELSLLDVDTAPQELGVVEELMHTESALRWKAELFGAIGMGLGMRAVQLPKPRNTHQFKLVVIGPKDRVEFAKLMTDWIAGQLMGDLNRALRTEMPPGANTRIWRREFLEAANARVHQRVKAQEREREQEAGLEGPGPRGQPPRQAGALHERALPGARGRAQGQRAPGPERARQRP